MTRVQANRQQYKKLSALNWMFCILAAAAAVALVFTVWFTGIMVMDDGMSPSLMEGDVILFNRLSKHMAHPERGDVYAFETEDGTAIGRIAALPGDKVTIKEGKVYIGGSLLREDNASESQWEAAEFTVPNASFLILPDERTGSLPQRADMLIPFHKLTGLASVRVSPISELTVFINK